MGLVWFFAAMATVLHPFGGLVRFCLTQSGISVFLFKRFSLVILNKTKCRNGGSGTLRGLRKMEAGIIFNRFCKDAFCPDGITERDVS